MANEYPNSGTINKSKFEKRTDRDTDYYGEANITCPHCQKESDFSIGGWIKEGESKKDGKPYKFIGIKFSEPRDKQQAQKPKINDFDSDFDTPF